MVNLLKDQKIKRRKHLHARINSVRFSIDKAVYDFRYKFRSSVVGKRLLLLSSRTRSICVFAGSVLAIGVFIFAGIQLSKGTGLPEPRSFEISFEKGFPGTPTVDISSTENMIQSGGAGTHAVDREEDIEHVVQEGETLSEIAYYYNIDLEKLAIYNDIMNADAIHMGDRLRVPSYANEKTLVQRQTYTNTPLTVTSTIQTANNTPVLKILAQEQHNVDSSVTVRLSVDQTDETEKFSNYEWHLGDGKKAWVKTAVYTYEKPGTYKVYLKVRNAAGRIIQSNNVYVDVPHPGSYQIPGVEYITLNKLGETFTIEGQIVSIRNYPNTESIIEFLGSLDNEFFEYKALKSGYFNLSVEKDGKRQDLYLFVSPIESVHAETKALNWYRTQFNTGTMGNCGPTTVSMGIAWATGEYVSVINVRESIGWYGEGETSFFDLRNVFRKYGVNARQRWISSMNDIFSIIDNGNIAIILFNTGGVSLASGNPAYTFFGKHYTDPPVGHYIVIKGYSADKKFFIVHDPMPSDWGGNNARYADGISMLGRNRYYSTHEIMNSLRLWEVLEVVR